MRALQVLADTTIQISVAKATLEKLKGTESEYLTSREKEAIDRVGKVIENSQLLLNEASNNYDKVIELANIIKDCAAFVSQAYDSLTSNVSAFERAQVLWENDIKVQEDRIEETKRGLRIQQTKIDNAWKSIDETKAGLLEQQKKLDSDRGALERSIKRLEKGRV